MSVFPVTILCPPASGGMDNQVTIHDLNNRDSNGQAKVIREISAFEGFLSCARFLDDTQLVTGSADMKMYAPMYRPE